MGISQETENRNIIWPSYTTPGHIPKGLYTLLQRCLLTQIYYCSVHNSQALEPAQVPINVSVDKGNTVQIQNGI